MQLRLMVHNDTPVGITKLYKYTSISPTFSSVLY